MISRETLTDILKPGPNFGFKLIRRNLKSCTIQLQEKHLPNQISFLWHRTEESGQIYLFWQHPVPNINIDDEVNSTISKASSIFGRLINNVWHRSDTSLSTKLKVYKSAVLPVLLYASETWTAYQRHAKKLNHFHTICLRRIMNIK
jgi:hypothetical protein